MNNGSAPETEEIRGWLAALDQKDLDLQRKIEPLLKEQAANRERRRLLTDLLASYGDGKPAVAASTVGVHETVRDRVRREVRLILEDAGQAMHINDIHAEFIARGFEVPGRGQPANITAHLSGSGDIVSPERGLYGLESVVGPVRTKPKPARRRRSATKSRKQKG